MLLSLFLVSCASFQKTAGEVISLTMENWDSLIDKRDPDSVWFIMFSGENCPACRVTEPIFRRAAIESDGMVNFGIVKAEQEAGLQLRLNIKMLPTWIIIHKDGRTDYTGKRSERAMVNAAAKMIPDKSATVERDWAEDGQASVILFTEKEKTPPIWSAISCAFKGRIRVGVSRDQGIMDLFKVEHTPAILFVNKTHKIAYHGKNSFMYLRQSIEEFLEGDYEEPLEFNVDYLLPEEYEEECASMVGYCVLQAGRTLDPRMRDARDKFKSDRMKFMYGEDNLPLNWIEKGEIYVIAPHKKAAMKVGHGPSDLNVAMSSVLDGSAKWTSFEEMEKNKK